MNSNYEALRILFMGTPGFAVPSLEILLANECNVVGVVTVADKPAGRGYQLQESPVKKAAVSAGLKVLQPTNLKAPEFLQELEELKIDLIVIVAFRKLPKEVWGMPKRGTFNLHGSLLPDYRGAAPLNWAVMNGETKTGVTTFFLEEKIDTGEIIDQVSVEVKENDSVGDIHDQLMIIGSELVMKTVKLIGEGEVKTTDQNEMLKGAKPKLAPKIFKKDCLIDWKASSQEVHNHVRGLSPYPAAHSEMKFSSGKNKKVKVFSTEKLKGTGVPGRVETDDSTFVHVYCGTGKLQINELQLEGKKKMKTTDFLRGNSLTGCSFIVEDSVA